MSYNKQCFDHLREWKKEQRRLLKWKTDSIYVDVETGEIINKDLLKNGEYIKIKSTTNLKTKNNVKSKTITTECRASAQRRLF